LIYKKVLTIDDLELVVTFHPFYFEIQSGLKSKCQYVKFGETSEFLNKTAQDLDDFF